MPHESIGEFLNNFNKPTESFTEGKENIEGHAAEYRGDDQRYCEEIRDILDL